MGEFVSDDDVKDYMSSPVVVDTYDDNNDGTVDGLAMARVIKDSEAIFKGTLRGIYELPLTAPLDPLCQTIVLRLVHCQTIKRFPERFRNGLKVCEDVGALLKSVRNGELQLDHPLLAGSRGPAVDSYCPRGYESLEMSPSDD